MICLFESGFTYFNYYNSIEFPQPIEVNNKKVVKYLKHRFIPYDYLLLNNSSSPLFIEINIIPIS